MKPDILRYRTEFTLDEVARLWAGVETETPENREDVLSALRILLKGIADLKLFKKDSLSIADVPLLTETGDYNYSFWRSVVVTREQLEEWFAREGWPLPPWLDSEAFKEEFTQEGQLIPNSRKPKAGPSISSPNKKGGYSQETLFRFIGVLMILWVQKSGPGARIRKRINGHTLHVEITQALKQAGVEPQGLSQGHFYKILEDILTEDFYAEFGKMLNPKK